MYMKSVANQQRISGESLLDCKNATYNTLIMVKQGRLHAMEKWQEAHWAKQLKKIKRISTNKRNTHLRSRDRKN